MTQAQRKADRGLPAKLVRRAKDLAGALNATPIDLAEALYEEAGAIQKLVKEGRIKQRHAYYLQAVWARFSKLEVPKSRLVGVGWTRLAVIASKCPPGDELKWIERAEKGTPAADLERVSVRGDDSDRHSILLRLTDAQHRVFHNALREFGAEPDRSGKGLAKKEEALTRALKQLMHKVRPQTPDRPSGRVPTKPPRSRKPGV